MTTEGKPRLLDQVRGRIRTKGYAKSTVSQPLGQTRRKPTNFPPSSSFAQKPTPGFARERVFSDQQQHFGRSKKAPGSYRGLPQ